MFKYRLYPSGPQQERIINSFQICKAIYNDLLALSIDAYTFGNVSLSGFDFNRYLTGKYPEIHSQVKQNVSDRVHKAFDNFFRRIKDTSCKEKGYPRFKSRVHSITFPQSGFKLLSYKRLRLSKIGNLPIVLHRIPQGKIKTMTIKQNKVGQWFAIFSCELPDRTVIHPSKDTIGIDVGIENFVTLSNGEVIANPRFLIKSERRLQFMQRGLSRKIKGSSNRRKARFRLAKQYLKVTNQRTNFLHKCSRNLALRFSTIAVEDLNIKNMMHDSYFAKSIGDAGWKVFFTMLSYKAVMCGGQVLKNPQTRGSSHRCSTCGFYVEDMPLSKRIFTCPQCLKTCHRDLNASLNHIKDTVGTDCAKPNACEHTVRPTSLAVVDEAGTITTKPSTSSVVGSPFLKSTI